MTPEREYELLARIEQLKDELESARTTITEREQEIQQLKWQKEQMRSAYESEMQVYDDELRAKGAV